LRELLRLYGATTNGELRRETTLRSKSVVPLLKQITQRLKSTDELMSILLGHPRSYVELGDGCAEEDEEETVNPYGRSKLFLPVLTNSTIQQYVKSVARLLRVALDISQIVRDDDNQLHRDASVDIPRGAMDALREFNNIVSQHDREVLDEGRRKQTLRTVLEQLLLSNVNLQGTIITFFASPPSPTSSIP